MRAEAVPDAECVEDDVTEVNGADEDSCDDDERCGALG